MPLFLDYHPDDIDVRVAELIVATHDSADPLTHPKVTEALGLLRRHLSMDVAFVSQLKGSRRTYRVVEKRKDGMRVEVGHSDPIEESWCQYVVEGRMPGFVKDAQAEVDAGRVPALDMRVGTFMSTPIKLVNGDVYGTLCCFSGDVVDGVSELDLRRLQIAAQLLSENLHSEGIGRELQLDTDFSPTMR